MQGNVQVYNVRIPAYSGAIKSWCRSQPAGFLAVWIFLAGLVVVSEFNPLKVELLARDVRAAQKWETNWIPSKGNPKQECEHASALQEKNMGFAQGFVAFCGLLRGMFTIACLPPPPHPPTPQKK